MSDKPLDERPHEPTESKLSRLRRKGDVAKSEEFTTGFRFFFILLTVTMMWEQQLDSLKNLFITNLDRVMHYKTSEPLLDWSLMLQAAMPVFILSAVGISASWLAKIIDIRGIVLNIEGLKLNMNQLNPVNGIKEVFSLNSFLKFISSLFKFTILTIAMLLLFFQHANSAIWSVSCGRGCQLAFGVTILGTITGVYLLLLIVSAAIDMKLSRFLHNRKNRMSTQELRQERRDNNGSPEMRNAQRNFREELSEDAPEQQSSANLVIHGEAVVHALHVYANSPAIIIQTAGIDLVKRATEAGVLTVQSDALAEQLQMYPHRKPLPAQIDSMIRQLVNKL